MKSFKTITIPEVHIPEHELPIISADLLPSGKEMMKEWDKVEAQYPHHERKSVFHTWVADRIKTDLAADGYDVSIINGTDFYFEFEDPEYEPETFEETMNTAFP